MGQDKANGTTKLQQQPKKKLTAKAREQNKQTKKTERNKTATMEKQSTNSRSQASREASQQTPRSQAQKPKTMTRNRQTWEEAYSVDQNLESGLDLGH